MHKLTTAELIAAGYRPFHESRNALEDWYRASFQKRFTDEHGTRYFITIVQGTYPDSDRIGVLRGEDFFSPETQFRRGETTFNVKMLHHHETAAEIEAFFEEMFTAMKLDYYEKTC